MPNFLNLKTEVLKMKKTSVLVLLSGLFDRSRSRTVTALLRLPRPKVGFVHFLEAVPAVGRGTC